jgi:hypothetical protein
MTSSLRALVISPNQDTLQRIEAAFTSTPNIELSLQIHWTEAKKQHVEPNVLILHSDSASEWLRYLRTQGYHQPALVLTEDTENPSVTALEEDLLPVENVTWGVIRAGKLASCVDMLLSAATI